jgi:environmental stress-induced protein Ves
LNFDGEESIECELINGVVQDFGLIYRKDRYHVEATHHEIATLTNIPLSEGAHFLRALGGDLIVDGTALAGHDVLQINGAAMLAVEAKAIGVQLLRLSLKAVNM